MNIQEVYNKYKIMPSLQMHMYRVTGVAKLICDNSKVRLDTDSVVAACLLHDMGNILKFNLDLFPQFLEPEGLDYWQKVKEEFRKKYGDDEHEATYQIAKELQVDKRTLKLVHGFGFGKAEEVYGSDDTEQKICNYADMRVTPHGVTSLSERLTDGEKRFQLNKPQVATYQNKFEELSEYIKLIEEQIFLCIRIAPEEVIEEKVQLIISHLKGIVIS